MKCEVNFYKMDCGSILKANWATPDPYGGILKKKQSTIKVDTL